MEFGIVAIVMIISTPFGCVALILRVVGFKPASIRITHKIAQIWALVSIAGTGCTMRVLGQENIPCKGALCFVSNHSGLFDILLLLAYSKRPFGFIAKKELSFIPFLNVWILMLGGYFIDRKNPRKAFATINRGVSHISKGGAMIIFPEGTRSKGRGLLPFRAGAFKLATRSNAQLVPIAITGSYDVFERQKSVIPRNVTVQFAPPIPPAEFETNEAKHQLAERVYGIIDEMLKTH
jgi:1-acyl-sn-glycerol-3-phosphate acyltransferase